VEVARGHCARRWRGRLVQALTRGLGAGSGTQASVEAHRSELGGGGGGNQRCRAARLEHGHREPARVQQWRERVRAGGVEAEQAGARVARGADVQAHGALAQTAAASKRGS
jgi:hypothetical protein